MHPKALGTAGAAALLLMVVACPALAADEPYIRVIPDDISYNVGSTVRVRIIPGSPGDAPVARFQFFATILYEGESKPVVRRAPLSPSGSPADSVMTLWSIPYSARTGRYTVDIETMDPHSKKILAHSASAASFAVHRKLVRIERIDLGKTFFSPGDPVSCRVALRNLSDRSVNGLRVEFSERYWPWIARSSSDSKVDTFPIVTHLSLKPGAALEVRSEKAAVARTVTEASVQQYAVVVWDNARQNVLDIAFSSLTFIRPPGASDARPYPLQYIYPKLSEVDTTSYRQTARDASGIRFDERRTMFAPGSTASISFSVSNPTNTTWNGVRIQVSLLTQENKEVFTSTLAEDLTLPAHGAPLEQKATLSLPGEGSGLYRAAAEVISKAGETLARGELEIAANPMPRSILIFCAHEDDEGAHAGMIRAAAENNIPVHLVYFTSGDSGSCDRYYQHSCNPAEALNFGGLRMEEARAGVGHLGVPRENIHFLGLPDGGSGEIWYRHMEPARPYLSVLLASDHAPYSGLEIPNLPYSRRSAVDAAKGFITRLQPEIIYTGHPDERHVDHRTNNWFVVQAMQELAREGKISPATELRVDQVYGPGPQKAAPYRYEKHVLFVSKEARELAQEAGWFYQSQRGNRSQGKIRLPDQLPREEIHWRILDWADHAGWNSPD